MKKINLSQSLNTKIIAIISLVIILGMGGLGYLINNTVTVEITGLARDICGCRKWKLSYFCSQKGTGSKW